MFFFFLSISLSNDLYRNVRSKERKLITIKKEMTENLDNVPTIDGIELEIIKYSNILLKEEKLLEFKGVIRYLLLPIGIICLLILPANFSTAALLFINCLSWVARAGRPDFSGNDFDSTDAAAPFGTSVKNP